MGQGKLEEIDLLKLGGNYGWKVMEGTSCYSPASNCDKTGLILPVVEYPHSQGVSVTGGYVYRGVAIPGLIGRYVYGDFGSGRIWAIREDPVTGKPTGQELLQSGLNIKEFTLGGKRIETRLFVRHQDGDWAGYSYEWNDAQTDATYVPGGKTKTIAGQSWLYPSSAQCLRCHTEKAGRTLGLELAQLNRTGLYPSGVTAHQITTLDKIGMLAAPLPAPVDQLPRLPDPFGADPLPERARSYLHTNCAFCHLPGGTGLGDADYRYTTPFASMKVCGVAPTQDSFGLAGAQVIAPGKPELSVLSLRVKSLDLRRMPPLGSSVVDPQGAALLDAFIASLAGCNP